MTNKQARIPPRSGAMMFLAALSCTVVSGSDTDEGDGTSTMSASATDSNPGGSPGSGGSTSDTTTGTASGDPTEAGGDTCNETCGGGCPWATPPSESPADACEVMEGGSIAWADLSSFDGELPYDAEGGLDVELQCHVLDVLPWCNDAPGGIAASCTLGDDATAHDAMLQLRLDRDSHEILPPGTDFRFHYKLEGEIERRSYRHVKLTRDDTLVFAYQEFSSAPIQEIGDRVADLLTPLFTDVAFVTCGDDSSTLTLTIDAGDGPVVLGTSQQRDATGAMSYRIATGSLEGAEAAATVTYVLAGLGPP